MIRTNPRRITENRHRGHPMVKFGGRGLLEPLESGGLVEPLNSPRGILRL